MAKPRTPKPILDYLPRRKEEPMEIDYWYKLSPDEKEWLKQFNKDEAAARKNDIQRAIDVNVYQPIPKDLQQPSPEAAYIEAIDKKSNK